MRANLGIFRKKDGSLRTMRFVDLSDLPEGFFTSQTKGSAKKTNLAQGSSLVWDLDKQDFRVFNKNTIIGEVKNFEIESLNHFELVKDFE